LHCWRVGAAQSIGGMDEALGLHAADDWGFSWRVAGAGFVFPAPPEGLYMIRDHRRHLRPTTPVPPPVHVAGVRQMLRGHRRGEGRVRLQSDRRRAGYMQQALFATDEDRRRKERAGFDPGSGWREPYR